MAERVVHFEITADDPERAAAFYRDTFGWAIKKFEGPIDYWLISSGDGPGVDGAIMPRAHNQPVIDTIQVETPLEDAIARATKAGGKHVDEIHHIPYVGRFTYMTDTEGNVFGIIEPEPGPS